MSFLAGGMTALRFRVDGPQPGTFDESHVERLSAHAAGQQRVASADGVECGWGAGDHAQDTDFTLAKNVVGDALVCDLRVDTDKLPGDKLKSYYQIELKALAVGNPSGLPSSRQKKEARENARDRLELEAKDGRFKRRKCVPVLWDGPSNTVWFGATSYAQVDRLTSLFQQTFGHGLDAMTAGRQARLIHGDHGSPPVTGAVPSPFIPGVSPSDIAWIADDTSRDFLGNELLLWLWFLSEGDTETVKLSDGSEVTYMLARRLVLDCPRGQTGYETISHEGPSRLPEAKRAIQSGKLPRTAGLTLVRHDQQYELTLHAESFAVQSAKLPAPDDERLDATGRRFARVGQCRHLLESLDLLLAAFLADRLSAKWASDTLPRMQRWLSRDGL